MVFRTSADFHAWLLYKPPLTLLLYAGCVLLPENILEALFFDVAPILVMVGQVGVEPTTPEGSGFTVRRVCRFATDPYGGKWGI